MSRSVILIGGPDSGKTNYVGRVWPALDSGGGMLRISKQPGDISFVLDVTDHLNAGTFAPRTDRGDARRDFEVAVATRDGVETSIVIPDISGELWAKAVREGELPTDWMEALRQAQGALLFVRVQSDQNVRALDWVTSKALMSKARKADATKIPTQVVLCELLRFLEVSLAPSAEGERPRVAIVVTAWDAIDSEVFEKGPTAWLEREYPLFGGRIRDCENLDLKVFGLSVVGGDLKTDAACRAAVQDTGLDGLGWVAIEGEDGMWHRLGDLTAPVAWAIGA